MFFKILMALVFLTIHAVSTAAPFMFSPIPQASSEYKVPVPRDGNPVFYYGHCYRTNGECIKDGDEIYTVVRDRFGGEDRYNIFKYNVVTKTGSNIIGITNGYVRPSSGPLSTLAGGYKSSIKITDLVKIGGILYFNNHFLWSDFSSSDQAILDENYFGSESAGYHPRYVPYQWNGTASDPLLLESSVSYKTSSGGFLYSDTVTKMNGSQYFAKMGSDLYLAGGYDSSVANEATGNSTSKKGSTFILQTGKLNLYKTGDVINYAMGSYAPKATSFSMKYGDIVEHEHINNNNNNPFDQKFIQFDQRTGHIYNENLTFIYANEDYVVLREYFGATVSVYNRSSKALLNTLNFLEALKPMKVTETGRFYQYHPKEVTIIGKKMYYKNNSGKLSVINDITTDAAASATTVQFGGADILNCKMLSYSDGVNPYVVVQDSSSNVYFISDSTVTKHSNPATIEAGNNSSVLLRSSGYPYLVRGSLNVTIAHGKISSTYTFGYNEMFVSNLGYALMVTNMGAPEGKQEGTLLIKSDGTLLNPTKEFFRGALYGDDLELYYVTSNDTWSSMNIRRWEP